MSIKLRRVELSNIRSHKHVVFEPEDDGITAIHGANGTGKSTIVDSIAWTLYGTKPAGVSKTSAIYRNGAKWGKEKCYAIVEIEVDGQLLKIERRMISKAGAVECDVWEVDIDENGKETNRHVAGTAVSQVESYLRQRLKMDEKGFLAAVLVQQKQVDNLISATARERAQVIEKLTGISSITNALNNARQESNALKKVASLSVADEDSLVLMNKEHESLSQDIKDKKDEVNNYKKITEKNSAESEAIKAQVAEEEIKIAEVEDTRNKITTLNARIESQEESLSSVIEEKNEKKAALSRVVASTDINSIQSKLSELKKNLRSNEVTLSRMSELANKHKKQRDDAEKIINKSSIKDIDKSIENRDKNITKLESLLSKKENTNALILSLQNDANKIERAVNILTEGDGTCPTCLQHVDDVSNAVHILHEQKDTILSKKEEEEILLEKVETSIKKTEELIDKFNLLIDALNTSEELTEALGSIEDEKAHFEAEIATLSGEIEVHEKIYNSAKRQEESKQEYDRLLTRAEKISNEIESMKGQRENLERILKEKGTISPSALSRLRKQSEVAIEKTNKSYNDFIRATGELSLIEEKLSNLSKNIERAEDELKKHKDLLNSVEVATTTTKVIEEFREDRIKNSIPVIEVYASDLLNRFTEGRFTQLKIDSKFNTTVILADGTERAVGLLSGGELSAAAMALRISISMLLNGSSSKNLIILDEVLVSQDTNRSELILSTVKDVCKGQVIIIAHNDSIDSIADNVVELSAS